jgi:hypothetical protein
MQAPLVQFIRGLPDGMRDPETAMICPLCSQLIASGQIIAVPMESVNSVVLFRFCTPCDRQVSGSQYLQRRMMWKMSEDVGRRELEWLVATFSGVIWDESGPEPDPEPES